MTIPPEFKPDTTTPITLDPKVTEPFIAHMETRTPYEQISAYICLALRVVIQHAHDVEAAHACISHIAETLPQHFVTMLQKYAEVTLANAQAGLTPETTKH